MKFTNRKILITGGTSGIGLEMGQQLRAKGNKVVLLGRNPEKLARLADEGFDVIQCDLSKTDDIEATVLCIHNQHPDISVLVNNAGIQHNYIFTDSVIPIERIRNEIDVNLTGQLLLTQLLIPILSTKKEALIVNTSSALGAYPKNDGLVYSASKAGMRSFTLGLRNVLKNTSVKVSEIVPPVTDTDMTAGRNERKHTAKEVVSLIIPKLEKGRKLATISSIRIFLLIAWLWPNLAQKTLNSK